MQLNDDTNEILLVMQIPNQLLYDWHTRGIPLSEFSGEVNSKIVGRVVKLKSSHRPNERLRSQAAKVAGKCQKLRCGRRRAQFLQQSFNLSVLGGECDSFEEVEERMLELENEVERKDEEITELLQDMARVIIEPDTAMTDITNTVKNSGKTIEEVSPRQARRKINKLKVLTRDALWFAESFGLVPQCVLMQKTKSGSPVKVTLGESTSSSLCQPHLYQVKATTKRFVKYYIMYLTALLSVMKHRAKHGIKLTIDSPSEVSSFNPQLFT